MDKQTDKKTGLGSSLLLRRTESSQEPERPDDANVSDVSQGEMPERFHPPDTQTPEPSERPDARPSRKSKRQVVRDRCTLYLDQDVNQRLQLVASIEGKERSEVASELLRQYLPEYEVIQKQ